MHSTYNLHVSSEDKVISDESGSHFQVELGLALHDLRHYRVGLIHAGWMHSRPVIHDYNNKIYFNRGSGQIVATLTNGFYTASTLATEIAAVMTDADPEAGAAYTVTYSSVSNKYVVASNNAARLFRFEDGVFNVYRVAGFYFKAIDLPTAYYNDVGNSPFSAPYQVDLSGTKYIDVETSLDSHSYATNARSFFARIPVTAAPGYFNNFEPNPIMYHTLKDTHMRSMEVRIRDDLGNPYVVEENVPITFTFQFVKDGSSNNA